MKNPRVIVTTQDALGLIYLTINPMTTNPPCPKCHYPRMRSNGKTAAGSLRYRCRCGHSLTVGKAKRGRPLLGDHPQTAAERMRKTREKIKNKK